jgi:hypothetical protein
MMFKYTQATPAETRTWLLSFYKEQLRLFTHIGIGGRTRFGVKITEKLIRCTANRLDQIKTGKKTASNTCYFERMMKILGRPMGHPYSGGKPQLINSNRSFISGVTSKFSTADLGDDSRFSLEYNQDRHYCSEMHRRSMEYTPYTDDISTAYNSEIMQAVLSHDR